MSYYANLRRTDGNDVWIDGELVLGLWPHNGGTRLWSAAYGYLDVQGSVAKVADTLDFPLPALTPEERA